MTASPFVFQQPLAPEGLRGRDVETGQIIDAVTAGNAITVTGPRRYGKTSLLLAARKRLLDDDHPVVLVDLYGTASLAELAVRLERGWAQVLPKWRKLAHSLLETSRLGLSLSGSGIGVTFQRQPRTDPLPALHALLALPEQLGSAQRRVVVIFDEFQSFGDLAGAEGLLRSHIQHHREWAGYVFAGSEAHLLGRQFDDPDRPFYGQALRMRLGRPPRAALRATMEDGFATTGREPGPAIELLLDFAEDHPQRAMLLAHFLWQATPQGGTAGLGEWDAALAQGRTLAVGEVQGRYEQSSRNQQRVLRALAHHLSPFASAVREPLGLDAGSVSKTVDQAQRDSLIEPVDSRGYRIVDPLLADWIRRCFP